MQVVRRQRRLYEASGGPEHVDLEADRVELYWLGHKATGCQKLYGRSHLVESPFPPGLASAVDEIPAPAAE
jgi:hypothetical protein